ncbi:MAG TPA: hypothetical protein VME40_03480 [Caulobacteraceae bacterium]|nr:hypothetical protein [Caulobacteraceae bacterium]
MRSLIGVLFVLALVTPAAAKVRIFSYDPANSLTRRVAGDLTFEFNQRLIFTTVLRIHSTEGEASADLKPVDEHVLGHGGLNRLIGSHAQERDLYAVKTDAQGAELIHAFCPGSTQAWLAFSRMVESRPLRIQVIGDDPKGGPTRLCTTLEFTFHGEWAPPPGPGVSQSQMLVPHFPY